MTPEIRIQQTVQKLQISDPVKEKEVYEKVLGSYYERYIKIVFELLNPEDQQTLATLIDSNADEKDIESFIETKLPDITSIAQDSLDHFLYQYEQEIGLIE